MGYEEIADQIVPVMSFQPLVFPEDISYGSKGGPGFKTTIVELDSGQELRYARWASPKRRYDISYGIKSLAQLGTLLDFYHQVSGNLSSFLYKDFLDFTTASDHRGAHDKEDVVIGTGDGVTTEFQLLAEYAGVFRTLSKPKDTTALVALDGATWLPFTLNVTTGIVTLATAPGDGVVVTAGCEFYTQTRFDVNEELMLSYDSYAEGSISGIELVEVLGDVPHPETYDYGGAKAKAFTYDMSIEVSDGRFQRLSPTASGITVALPPAAELELGGPHFFLENASGSNSVALIDGSVAIGTLAAGGFATMLVYKVGSDNRWVMLS